MWNHETAYERTASVLRRFHLDAVWAANDQISLGAQRAAIEAGEVPGQTMVFAGLNWSSDGLSAVRDGAMTMSHGGHFFAGSWSMVMIRDIANGVLPEGSHLNFPMSAVHSGNADQFLELFGSRNWDAIDFRNFTLSDGAHTDYRFIAESILEAAANR
jgi:ABC-type sugar transport system substrate-binding protein